MPRYKVKVSEKVYAEIEVEAESWHQATAMVVATWPYESLKHRRVEEVLEWTEDGELRPRP